MVRIRAACRGTETLLLALEPMAFPQEVSRPSGIQVEDSPSEGEWALLWRLPPEM